MRLHFSVPSHTFHRPHLTPAFNLIQVSSCPVSTQAATLDIVQAYRCSPIAPLHKIYIAFQWNNGIFVQHNVIEGLAPAGGIQGALADACIAILRHHGISPILKWVDDFVVFRSPCSSTSVTSNEMSYPYDLDSIFCITNPLGIPWHSISKKSQDFASSFTYLSFHWDLVNHTVAIPSKKRLQAVEKLNSFLDLSLLPSHHECASLHSTLQHLSFIPQDGQSFLAPLSSFLAKFPNNFIRHHPSPSLLHAMCWWKSILAHMTPFHNCLHCDPVWICPCLLMPQHLSVLAWLWVCVGTPGSFVMAGSQSTET